MNLLVSVELAAAASEGTRFHASAGPAYATYFPIDDGGIAEHLAVRGAEITAGFERAVDLGPVRLDLGLGALHLHEQIEGSYSLEELGPDYRANYDYAAIQGEAAAESRWSSRVNLHLGLTLGSAWLFSDRKGEPLRSHPLPVYGTFQGGFAVRLTDDIDATALVSWVPPVDKVSVLSPQVGARVRL